MFGKYKVLAVNHDAKTRKGTKRGYLTGILYFAPARLSGVNVCKFSTRGCRAACLYTAGRGRMNSTQAARIRKTERFFAHRAAFMEDIAADIRTLQRNAARHGLVPVVRLNGTSDLAWERIPFGTWGCIMDAFPSVQFYDYTKDPGRMVQALSGAAWPANYDLTFSRSETAQNNGHMAQVLHMGGRVAVVFGGGVPARWNGWTVVVGDETDLRFMDAPGCVVGLTAKGLAKRDKSGFVVWGS